MPKMRARRGGPELGEDFYAHTTESYDELAPSYDADIGSNVVGRRMREAFRRVLERTFRPGSRIFEIGCGTGIDALWLARQGIDVVATDISGEMVEAAASKARAEGLSERIQCRRLAAKDIGMLEKEFGHGTFDGGFCHAGALNMEPGLASIPGAVRALVPPGGAFVCSVINKTSLFEVVFYSAILRPRKAYRRLGNVVPIPVSRKPPLNTWVIPSRFFSPKDIIRLFGEGFRVESIQGLQILLPPSNLADWYSLAHPVLVPLERLEDRVSIRRPLNGWGHHTLLTFRRI